MRCGLFSIKPVFHCFEDGSLIQDSFLVLAESFRHIFVVTLESNSSRAPPPGAALALGFLPAGGL